MPGPDVVLRDDAGAVPAGASRVVRAAVAVVGQALPSGRRHSQFAPGFQAHGIGEPLLPLVIRRQAPKQLRKSEQPLTELLERGAYAR
jgi:hypothetical protein